MIRRHFSYTFLAKAIIFLGSLIQGVFATRLLGAEGKGLMSFLQANINLLILILGLTLPIGVIFFATNKKIPTSKILGFCYLTVTIALAIILLMFLVSFYYPSINFVIPTDFQTSFFITYFVLSFILTFLSSIYMATFLGHFAFLAVNVIELIVVASRLAFFGLFYYLKSKQILTLQQIFVADFVFTTMTFFFCVYYAHIKLKLKISFDLSVKDHIMPVLRYTIPLYWANLIAFAYTRMDYWIIESILGLKQLGIYSIASGLALLLTFFPMSINSVLYPYLTQRTDEDRNRLFLLISKINFSLVLVAAIILFFISSDLINFLYGNEFANSVGAFKILIWGYLLSSIKMLFTMKNQISERLKANIFAEIIVLMVTVVLNLILVPRIGIRGSATSMVIAQLCSFIFLLHYIRKYFRFSIRNLFILSFEDIAHIFNIRKNRNEHH